MGTHLNKKGIAGDRIVDRSRPQSFGLISSIPGLRLKVAVKYMGVWWGSSALTAAERFPFADKPWKEDVKEMMKRIWENDPTFIEAK